MFSHLRSFWRVLIRRTETEQDMADEMRFHVEERAADLMRSGMTRADAERRARIEFGGMELYKENCREARGLRFLDDLRADLRYAWRTLGKSPAFSLTAILTLSLGIGANTGLFTLINQHMLRPVPVKDPYSLYQVGGYNANRMRFGSFSMREYRDIAADNRVFSDVIADSQVRAKSEKMRLGGYVVSGNYFVVLGGGTLLGRPILPEDATPSAAPVAVLSYSAWQRAFQEDGLIVGKTIELAGSRFTIIGVATPDFTGLDVQLPEFWAPISTKKLFDRSTSDPEERSLRVIGRLRPGMMPDQAQSAMDVLLPRITESRQTELRLTAARLDSRATYQRWNHADMANVVPIFTAFALILLIACGNLANVLLARALNRQREIRLRLSLGASRGRIVRQLVTESAVLALCAGVVGLAFSHWSWALIRHAILSTFAAKTAMSIIEITPDYRVFTFAFVLSLATGILFGLAPALRATRLSLTPAIKDEGSFLGATIRRSWLRDGLVIAQFSLSLLLLIGAGLLLRSAAKFASIEPGFDLAHTVSVQIVHGTASADQKLGVRIGNRMKAMPGVVSVTNVLREPLRGSLPRGAVSTGSGDSPGRSAGYNEVSSGYFETLGIPLLRGRNFTAQEAASGAAVVVISEATAKRFWPDADPLGRTFRISTAEFSSGGRELFVNKSRTVQVVGVATDVVSAWLWDGTDETCVYLPAKASQLPYYSFLMRVEGRASTFLPAVRAALNAIDHTVEFDVRTMEEVMEFQVLPFRLASWGAASLGALGLLLACIGIYGVMSYTVSQRTKEIGIRMALGADRKHLLWMTLLEGFRLIGIGAGCGVVLGLGLSRILRAMIFKIDATDAATFILAPLILGAIGLLATYLPSRRATLVDPNVALKYE